MSWESIEALSKDRERERLDALRQGSAEVDDREAAEELVDLVEGGLREVGGGTRIDEVNDLYRARFRALGAVLHRLCIEHSNPYRDLWRFHASWTERGLATYASRRAYAAELYEPVRRALEDLEFAHLVDPVAIRPTGWVPVDENLAKLRARFRTARDAADYKAVGLLCGSTLQTTGRLVFETARHLPRGEAEPSPDDAKRRLGFYIDAVTAGRGGLYGEVRKLASATVRLSEAVKHARTPTRVEAGLAADATIQLINLVRRLAELDSR